MRELTGVVRDLSPWTRPVRPGNLKCGCGPEQQLLQRCARRANGNVQHKQRVAKPKTPSLNDTNRPIPSDRHPRGGSASPGTAMPPTRHSICRATRETVARIRMFRIRGIRPPAPASAQWRLAVIAEVDHLAVRGANSCQPRHSRPVAVDAGPERRNATWASPAQRQPASPRLGDAGPARGCSTGLHRLTAGH